MARNNIQAYNTAIDDRVVKMLLNKPIHPIHHQGGDYAGKKSNPQKKLGKKNGSRRKEG
jgi:hypothetical protein